MYVQGVNPPPNDVVACLLTPLAGEIQKIAKEIQEYVNNYLLFFLPPTGEGGRRLSRKHDIMLLATC